MFPSLSVRFVWFTEDHSKIKISDLFSVLVGEDADEVTVSKLATAEHPFLGHAAKEKDGRVTMLQLQPGRLDLVVQPAARRQMEDDIATIDTQSALDFLLDCATRADVLPRSVRLSVVTNTVELAAESSATAARLQAMIGLHVDIEGLSDYFFQVNRVKDLAGTKCNRLVQYSTTVFQSMRLQIDSQGGQSHQAVVGLKFGTSATYDFNTVPDGAIFETDKQKSVFEAIVGEVKKAATAESVTFLGDN